MIRGAVGCGPKVVEGPRRRRCTAQKVPIGAGNPKSGKVLPIRALRATSSPTTSNQRADDPGSGRLWAEGRGGTAQATLHGAKSADRGRKPQKRQSSANTGSESYIKPDDQQPAGR